MDDLISRQKAIMDAESWVAVDEHEKHLQKNVIEWLKEFPSAQPERAEGHWIRTDCGLDVECKCSRCGYKDFVEPRDWYWFKRNYCPHCGAKMKGAQNG